MSIYFYLIIACVISMFFDLLVGIILLLLIPKSAPAECKQRERYNKLEPILIIYLLVGLLVIIVLQHKYVQTDEFAFEQAQLELRRHPTPRERIEQAKEMLIDTVCVPTDQGFKVLNVQTDE